jgi:hypothetical protein
MKLISKMLLLSALVAGAFGSCKKDEVKVLFEGGTPPVLTASTTATIPMAFANAGKEAVKLSWTNPNYTFTTGVSSQDVSYQLQIDTTGANFTNPKMKTLSISKELSYTLTQGELNDYLLNTIELKPGMVHNLEFRIKSVLGQNVVPLFSNVLKFRVTPYAIPPKVDPPASGELYAVGSATPGGWNNPVPAPAQKFKKVSETLYELTINMVGGGSYLLLPVNGSWDAKFGATGANNTNNVNGDDFKAGGGDMLAPAASGRFKITVDFQRGKFTVTPA